MGNEEVKYTLTLNDLLTSKLVQADAAAGKLDATMGMVQAAASALGIVAGIAGVAAFANSMVNAGAKVEDARVGLTTLLKDSEAAGTVIKQTMEDAAKTPFAFEGLLAANKALISAGENATGARETVLNLANAIAATGGGDDELNRMTANLMQIKNTGVATAMDIKQFGFAGINIYQALADATGEPIEKVKDMEVSYDLLAMALKKAHDEGGIYANGLENMAGNTSVQISALSDKIFQLKVQMFDNLKPAISAVLEQADKFIVNLRESWEWLVENKDIVISLASALGTLALGAIAYNGYLVAMSAATAWQTALTFLNMLATDGLAVSLYAAGITGAAAWALMTMGLSLVVAGIVLAYQKSESFRNGIKLLADDAMIAANAIAYAWHFATGQFDSAKEDMLEMNRLLVERKELIDGTYSEHKGESVTGGAKQTPFSMLLSNTPANSKKKKEDKAAVDTSPSKATANKAVTVNISINKMIETFKIQTTNMQESTAKIQQLVANALLESVNQASIQADI
jgi:tape measure domain-containing protein